MKTKRTTRMTALLMAVLLLVSLLPWSVSASGESTSVTVTFQMDDGGFLLAKQAFSVPADLSERYGYQDSYAGQKATVLDALVAAHLALFGEEVKDFLTSENGFTSKVAGIDTYNFVFYVNGQAVGDGIYKEDRYNGGTAQTGFLIHETLLSEKDEVSFAILQDDYGMDSVAWFEVNGQKVTRITAGVNEPIALTLKGYMGYYSYSDPAWQEQNTERFEDARLVLTELEEAAGIRAGYFTTVLGTTDENGCAPIRFSAPGTYIVSAVGESGVYGAPILSPWLTVTVSLSEAEQIDADLAAIVSYFKGKTVLSQGGAKIYFALAEGGDESNKYPNAYDTAIYGTGEGQDTNLYDYLRRKAASLTGRDPAEITVSAGAGLPGTVGSGTPLAAAVMDDYRFGNLQPQYFETYPITFYIGAAAGNANEVKFTIGGKSTEGIGQIYFALQPLAADPAKKVALEASAILWERIRGLPATNPDQNTIRGKVGAVSGSTVGNLPGVCLYSNASTGVKIAWSLAYTGAGGDPGALTLSGSATTFGKRPNVGDPDAAYRLTATLTSNADAAVVSHVDFDLTVPAFAPRTVPLRVSPADAVISVTDSYYGAAVDGKYIQTAENGARRTYTLHGNVTDAAQSYSFTASAPGYISSVKTVSVTGDMPEQTITLVPSGAHDAKLLGLEVAAPAPGSASIQIPAEAFDRDVYDYHITVGGIASVTVRPTVLTEGATISVSRHSSAANANNGTFASTTVSSGSTSVCYLKTSADPAETVITVTVTAPPSSTQEEKTKVYTLTVTRNNVTYPLTALTLIPVGGEKNNNSLPAEDTLFPAIEAGGLAEEYVCRVNATREKIKLKPTAAGSTITVNGKPVASGSESEEIPLDPGDNRITLLVTPAGGDPVSYSLLVRRKREIPFGGFSFDGASIRAELGTWIRSYHFPSQAQTLVVTPDIPEGAVLTIPGIEGEYRNNDKIRIPVDDVPAGGSKMLSSVRVSQEFQEDGRVWTDQYAYVVSFYRMGADAPERVESYLPAPGQFVNQEAYRFPNRTLSANTNMVTLGAYGGSIVYYFEEPVRNDPNHPYGIDFIVYGNVFVNSDGSSASGASEPAAVMVSGDGEVWYELAGSMYYDAQTRHQVSVTYTNPDPTFSGAADVPWTDSDGNSGAVKKTSSHTQAYYPNPALYQEYNTGAGANDSYTEESMTLTFGSLFHKKHSPVYGYGDTHAGASTLTNQAVNPYAKEHALIFNGDGMDLMWAVDENGDPVVLDEVHYVLIYNPTLFDGGSIGECSPEISGITRAAPALSAVGKSAGLRALSINGKDLALTAGIDTYQLDIEGAQTLSVTPVAEQSDANILVNDQWVASGSASPVMLAGEKLRVLVQDGNKEPSIYTITLNGAPDPADNADIKEISVIPGELFAAEGADRTYALTVPNAVSGVRVRAVPLSDGATVQVEDTALRLEEDWLCGTIVPLTAGQTRQLRIIVTSANGVNTKIYRLDLTRGSAGGAAPIVTTVSFALQGKSEADGGVQTWISKRSYSVPRGSTVKYLTDLVLIEQGIPFITNSDGTYIASINGLAEFDRGPYSGWMYKINGKIAGSDGYADRVLKAGDTVQWFYTDDYTKETEYETGTSGSGSMGGAAAARAAVEPLATVSGGKATASVTDAQLADAVRAAKETKADAVVIKPVLGSGAASDFQITLSKNALEKSAEEGVRLQIQTAAGSVCFDPQAQVALAGAVSAGSLTFAIARVDPARLTDRQREMVGDGPVVDLTVLSGEIKLSDLGGGTAEISVPYARKPHETAEGLAVWYLAENGEITRIPCAYHAETQAVRFSVGHFSRYAVGYQMPQDDWINPFRDVKPSDWYYDAVRYVKKNGLMRGTDEQAFSPEACVTRAMLVTILYRCAGEPATAAEHSFADVANGQWYASAIAWASESGIVNGYGDSLFGPEDNVTREQFAVILYRFAQWKGIAGSAAADLTVFSDGEDVSDWAKTAMQWAVAAGLLQGRAPDRLAPDGTATRAEAAVLLMRFIEQTPM